MSKQIKSITFKGELKVWGIYNYNGPKDRKIPNGNTWYKNHRGAKTFTYIEGEKKREVDYTSSRCLRHEIFKDLQPKQPSDKVFADQFVEMVASEVGLLRGYMSPDEKNDRSDIKGLKRCSPLHIADATTIEPVDIVFDQGSSSKLKESKKGEKKNRKGEDRSDTSMFSQDNVPKRTQQLLGGINLKELQFLSLYGKDNDFSMIPKAEKNKFLKLLERYFQDHKVEPSLEIKEYTDKHSIYKVKRHGILLSQDQIRHLVKVVFQRIKMINGLKAGSRLAYQEGSLKVSFFDGKGFLTVNESDLKEELNNIAFHHFFEAV